MYYKGVAPDVCFAPHTTIDMIFKENKAIGTSVGRYLKFYTYVKYPTK